MAFALAPGISFCHAAGRWIFLDLSKDRYFCLAETADAAFTCLVEGGSVSGGHTTILKTLERAGTLVPAEGEARPSPCTAQRPVRSALDPETDRRIGVVAVLRAAIALQRAKSHLARRPLAQLCAGLPAFRQPGANPLETVGDRSIDLAAAFDAAGRLVGSLEQCLALSIAVTRSARRVGIRAELVFGVKLRPFQAHAWVQVDRLLLTDRLEIVEQFTPILAI